MGGVEVTTPATTGPKATTTATLTTSRSPLASPRGGPATKQVGALLTKSKREVGVVPSDDPALRVAPTPASTPAQQQAQAQRKAEVRSAQDQLPALVDPGADADYLSADELQAYQKQHAAARTALQEIAAKKTITPDELAAAKEKVTSLQTAALDLRGKAEAAKAKAESDNRRKEIEQLAVPDLFTNREDLSVYLDSTELDTFKKQRLTVTNALQDIKDIAKKPRVTQDDLKVAKQQVEELDTAASALRTKATEAKAESDSLRKDIEQLAVPDLFTNPEDLSVYPVYLDSTEPDKFEEQRLTVTKALQKIAEKPRVTQADKTDAKQQVEELDTAASALRTKATKAKAESDSLRKDIEQLAVPDLFTNPEDLSVYPVYLDSTELDTFKKQRLTVTNALQDIKDIAKKPRVTQDDKTDAKQQVEKLDTAASALRTKATKAKAASDNRRKEIDEWLKELAAVQDWESYLSLILSPTDRDAFTKQCKECTKLLKDKSEKPPVTAEAHKAAQEAFNKLKLQIQTLSTQANKAKSDLEAKRKTIEDDLPAVRKDAKNWEIDLATLNNANKKMTAAATKKEWNSVDAELDRMENERARIRSYIEELGQAKANTDTLPQKARFDVTKLRMAFQNEVRKTPRDDTKAAQALNAFKDAIQAVVDQEEAKVAGQAAAVALRQQKRDNGLLPDNRNRYQLREIGTTTRATVGTAEERPAVIEALDALKDPNRPHGWAWKWGEYHGNNEGNLPGYRGMGGYSEYYVRPVPGGANILRLVRHDATGFVYYSPNHYGSAGPGDPFVKVTDP